MKLWWWLQAAAGASTLPVAEHVARECEVLKVRRMQHPVQPTLCFFGLAGSPAQRCSSADP